MTDLQLKYWGLQEEKRHNLVYERETERHNRKGEEVSILGLSETKRHNVAQENIGYEQLGISRRQADASVINAQSAFSQAQTAARRASADILYTQSRTTGQDISNFVSDASKYGKITDAYVSPASGIVDVVKNVMGFFK